MGYILSTLALAFILGVFIAVTYVLPMLSAAAAGF